MVFNHTILLINKLEFYRKNYMQLFRYVLKNITSGSFYLENFRICTIWSRQYSLL